MNATADESRIGALAEQSPLGRVGMLEERANVVAFCDAASYVRGAELEVVKQPLAVELGYPVECAPIAHSLPKPQSWLIFFWSRSPAGL